MAQIYVESILSGKTMEQAGAGKITEVLISESPESVFHKLNRLFAAIDYQSYPINDEASLRAYVQVYLAGAGLHPRAEVHNYRGRSDLEVSCGNRHWIFEFKVARATDSASDKLAEGIAQITDRNYGAADGGSEIKRMALVFSVEKREFVKWAEA